ncbi:MAG: alanyl-tRNA editing protein [Treponema sp.]|jgi:alanyl-tRNA synthetase|nr:alanyl-tRNA editing protein [Treponema sp.]
MKTTAGYYDHASADPYAANIVEVRSEGDKTVLILDKTIFYPEGGGQGADWGTINGVPLLDVQEKEGEILHLVSGKEGKTLAVGKAELILDAARRRDLTVQHTAQHLLSGTILKLTGKYTVSMHLGEETNTIDVDAPELSDETLLQAEDGVMDAIEADTPVIIHLCPPEKAGDFPLRKAPPQGEEVIRVVEIKGNDFSPCCGTHLRSTGLIGMLRILGAEKYKGMTRVTFIAGKRVLLDSRALRQNGEIISRALKVPVTETGNAVLNLVDKANQLEKEIKELKEAAAHGKARNLLHKARILNSRERDTNEERPPVPVSGELEVYTVSYPDYEMEDMLHIGRAAQKLTSAVLVFFSHRENKFAAFCSAPDADIRPLFKGFLEAHGGRGGGGPSFFQGSFTAQENLDAFIASLPHEADVFTGTAKS